MANASRERDLESVIRGLIDGQRKLEQRIHEMQQGQWNISVDGGGNLVAIYSQNVGGLLQRRVWRLASVPVENIPNWYFSTAANGDLIATREGTGQTVTVAAVS